ncbi:AGC/PKA protein kinase [Coprinopsis sp. MPI-PUGE-AT-0042]|nr:AGC/PKA protein kinase [Coprinopsis sp. MPI-PUGE-AT-0042]
MPATRRTAKTRDARKDVEAVTKRSSHRQSPEQSGAGGPPNTSSVVIIPKLEDEHILVAASRSGREYKYEYSANIQTKPLPDPLDRNGTRRPPPLQLKDLEVVQTLGGGSQGKVYTVRTTRDEHKWDLPGTLLVVKRIKKQDMRVLTEPSWHRYIMDAEREVLVSLPWNPFIAGIIDAFDDKRNLYLVLECMPHGTLKGLIKQFSPMSPGMASFYFANVVCGLTFLHSRGIVHLDIKPPNIVLGADGYLCLTDFGSALLNPMEETSWNFKGTPLYAPPELLRIKTEDAEGDDVKQKATGAAERDPEAVKYPLQARLSADWYSAGTVLYQMVTQNEKPFQVINDENNIEKLAAMKRRARFQFSKETSVGKQGKSFIKKLLSADPALRPDFVQIREHPWLSNINWASMETKQYYPPYSPPPASTIHRSWHRTKLPDQRQVPGIKVEHPPVPQQYDNRFPPWEA